MNICLFIWKILFIKNVLIGKENNFSGIRKLFLFVKIVWKIKLISIFSIIFIMIWDVRFKDCIFDIYLVYIFINFVIVY